MKTILITGATGNVGREVVKALQGRDAVCLLRPLLSVPTTFHMGPTSIPWTPEHSRNPR